MKKSLLCLLLAAAASVACSSSPSSTDSGDSASDPGDDAFDSTSQPIISGKASPSSQDAVVLLVHMESRSTFSVCTGTLVAPNLVLTARHCVSASNEGAFGCDDKGNLSPGSKGGSIGADYNPGDIYVYTGTGRPDVQKSGPKDAPANAMGKKIFHDDGRVICSHDLGLILLDRDITSSPLAAIRLNTPVRKGEKFTAIGWGATLSDDFPKQRQVRTGIPVEQVGPFSGSKTEDPVPPNDFQVGEATCLGDSGGPAMSEVSGAVIGVVSRGGNGNSSGDKPSDGCVKASNDYTQTSPFKSLIEQAFREAGHDPIVETGNQDPGGGSGSKKGCSVGPVGASSTPTGGALAMMGLGIALAAIRRNRMRVRVRPE